MKSRGKWKPIVLGLLILVFGIGIGASGTLIVLRQVVLYRLHHPQEAGEWLRQVTTRALHLSSAEQERVAEIFAKHAKELNRIRCDTYPRVNQLLDAMHDEVAAALDPGKAGVWRKCFEHIRGTWMLPPPLPLTGSAAAGNPPGN